MLTGTLLERLSTLQERWPTAEPLSLARGVRVNEFNDGFITIEELFDEMPADYLEAAKEVCL